MDDAEKPPETSLEPPQKMPCGTHPNSLANLNKFTSENNPRKGGVAGRMTRRKLYASILDLAPKAAVTAAQKEMGMGDDYKPVTIREQVVAALVLKALAGDTQAIKEIQDAEFGKIADKAQVTHTVNTMPPVTVGARESGQAAQQVKELTFDVGEPPKQVVDAEFSEIDSDDTVTTPSNSSGDVETW